MRLALAVWVTPPLEAVIVNGYVPAAVVVVVVTVIAEGPLSVTVAGLNPAVAPAGSPLTVSPIAPVNPFKAASVIVYVALAPAAID